MPETIEVVFRLDDDSVEKAALEDAAWAAATALEIAMKELGIDHDSFKAILDPYRLLMSQLDPEFEAWKIPDFMYEGRDGKDD